MNRKRYRTKFPMARIKKIMQIDEDVGKVAQATPILISKALEMFMQDLVDGTCAETVKRHATRLTVVHLKRCIAGNSQFDFLHELVKDIEDDGDGDLDADLDVSSSKERGGSGEKVETKQGHEQDQEVNPNSSQRDRMAVSELVDRNSSEDDIYTEAQLPSKRSARATAKKPKKIVEEDLAE